MVVGRMDSTVMRGLEASMVLTGMHPGSKDRFVGVSVNWSVLRTDMEQFS